MSQSGQALFRLNAATILFGFTALFPKIIDLTPTGLVFARSLVAAAALALLVLSRRRSVRLGGAREYACVLLLGCLLSSHWVTYFHAVQVSTVAVGILSLFTFPVITVFLEPLVFGTRVKLFDIATAGSALVGVALIVPEFSLESHVAKGALWGVLSAFLISLRNVFQRRFLPARPSSVVMLYQVSVSTLFLLPFLPRGFEARAADWMLPLILLGVFFTALPHTLLVSSLARLEAKTVGIVASLQPAYGVLLAAIFLSEIPSRRTLVGGAVIVSAALIESIRVRGQGT
jgi:drug/metabolite transporter (DMT)-like permease